MPKKATFTKTTPMEDLILFAAIPTSLLFVLQNECLPDCCKYSLVKLDRGND